MIVRTFEGLQAMSSPTPTWSSGGAVNLYGAQLSYSRIYATQPNVRTPADFFAFNLAHLGLHVYRRVSDTDRVRLADHQLAQWIAAPNPWTTRYRLFEQLGLDLCNYSNGYWLKVRLEDRIALVRLPAEEMSVTGRLRPTSFVWTANGREKTFAPSEIVFFRWSAGYDADRPMMGLSRLETLRRIVAEEAAAGEHREAYWRSSSRQEGVIEQTKEAPNWTQKQQDDFRDRWQAYAGGGDKVAMTAILPKGMTYKATSWSAKDSEYVQGLKLRREITAGTHMIPQPFVGILDHATFSNITEQHKNLYQDTLGPPLKMIEEDIEAQLLIECDDQRNVYTEFNIAEKLKGSFEEQASAMQVAVGKPWMTVNEARARQNLPRDPDPASDRIAAQQGGPATNSPQPDDEETAPAPPDNAEPPADDETANRGAAAPVLQAARARQLTRLTKVPAAERSTAFFGDIERWNRELEKDLVPVVGLEAAQRLAIQANVATFTELESLETEDATT